MVKIKVLKDKDGFIWRLWANGHAGYDRLGKDIVCAAVSVTFFNAAGALEELIGLRDFYIEEDGKMDIRIPEGLTKDDMMVAGIIMQTTFIGLKQIHAEYSKQIKVIEEIL